MFALWWFVVTAHAQDVLPVPPLSAAVIDQTATLDDSQRAALIAKLAAIEQQTGSQIVVLMVPSTLPEDIEATIAAAGTALAPQLMVTRAFRDMVSEVLSSSEGIDLPHTLLHVACDPAKAQQLGTLALQRKIRDAAMSVDPSGLWLFLFGCPVSRAGGVAVRVFGRNHPEIASGISTEGTTGDIARRLERLAGAFGVREADAARSGGARAAPPVSARRG
jgi:hypothetical protein